MNIGLVNRAVQLAETLGPLSTPEQWKELDELKQEMTYVEFKDYLEGIRNAREVKK